jgi:Ras GTPase-activating-like protein IQGAP2/3
MPIFPSIFPHWQDTNTEERERMWRFIMFTLYGDQSQARDEFNLLTLAHQLFTERGGRVPNTADLLERSENLGLLIQEYSKRNACLRAAKMTLASVINEVLERGQKMEVNPIEIYSRLHPKADNIGDLTFSSAMQDPVVKEIYNESVRVLSDTCFKFLKRITASHSLIPYGMRWIAKRLDEIAEEKLPPGKDKRMKQVSLVCRFIFSRLFNQGILQPEILEICSEPPSQDIKVNLVLIMTILDRVVSIHYFKSEKEEEHMVPFNKIIRTAQDLLLSYAEFVTSVKSLELHNRESRYIQTLSSLTPIISISVNDIDFLHRLIDQGFRAGNIPGERKEWMKILGRAGVVHGDVEPQLNTTINVRIRLSDRVIWPETEQPAELLEDKDIKTQLLLALQVSSKRNFTFLTYFWFYSFLFPFSGYAFASAVRVGDADRKPG